MFYSFLKKCSLVKTRSFLEKCTKAFSEKNSLTPIKSSAGVPLQTIYKKNELKNRGQYHFKGPFKEDNNLESLLNIVRNPRLNMKINECIYLLALIEKKAKLENYDLFKLKDHLTLVDFIRKNYLEATELNSGYYEEDWKPLVGTFLGVLNDLKYGNTELWLLAMDKISNEEFELDSKEVYLIVKNLSLFTNEHELEPWQNDILISSIMQINIHIEEALSKNYYNNPEALNLSLLYTSKALRSQAFTTELLQKIEGKLIKTLFNVKNDQNFDYALQFCYNSIQAGYLPETVFQKHLLSQMHAQAHFISPEIKIEDFKKIIVTLGFAVKIGSIRMDNYDHECLQGRFFNFFSGEGKINDCLFAQIYEMIPYLLILFKERGLMEYIEALILKNDLNLQLQQILHLLELRINGNFFSSNEFLALLDLKMGNSLVTHTKLKVLYADQAKIFFRFCKLLDDNDINHYFPQTFRFAIDFLIKHVSCFDFEEICLLYYVIQKNKELLNLFENVENFEGKANILKENIKIHYSSLSRTKQPGVSSNFYKILEVVKVEEFYSYSQY